MKLDIKFQSQNKNSTRLDCGAFAAGMVAGVDGDDILRAIDHPPNTPLSFDDMQLALSHYGVSSIHDTLSPTGIKNTLNNGLSLIALVGLENIGNHFIVLTGWDNNGVWYHDPLASDGYSYTAWIDFVHMQSQAKAWQPGQALIVDRVFEIIEDEPVLSAEERLMIALSDLGRCQKITAALVATLEQFADLPEPNGEIVTGKSRSYSFTTNAVYFGESPDRDRYDLPFSVTIPDAWFLHFGGESARVTEAVYDCVDIGDVWEYHRML